MRTSGRWLAWLLLASSAAAAEPPVPPNWPSFRGAGGAGVASGSGPERWNGVTGENVLWKTALPGLSLSSPIVWGDRIYVTTAVGQDPDAKMRTGLYGDVAPAKDLSKHQWKVIALDRATGKIVWERTAHEGIPRTTRHPKSTQANPTAAPDGRHVVAFFGAHGLYTYDASGKLLWQKDLGTLKAGWFYDPDFEWGVGSSPILFKDLVIVQCDVQQDSFIAAFRLKDGSLAWRTSRDEIPGWATPTIVDAGGRFELVTNATKFVRGYDPLTGKELWRVSAGSEIAVPTPFAAHGLVFVASGYGPGRPIHAIRPGGSGDIAPKDGETTSPFVAWTNPRTGPYMPTPIVVGDELYVVQNNGALTTYQAKTGTRVYQQRLGNGGAFTASPVAADGKLYFATEEGEVHVVRAGPSFELVGTNPVGEAILATPALADGTLYVRGQRHLFAIREPAAKPSPKP